MRPMKSLQFLITVQFMTMYYFIIKEFANELEGQFECLVENTEKYKTFPFQQKKKLQVLIKMVMKVLSLYLKNKIY